MDQIRLNFFALANQEIIFRLYRQEYSGQDKKEGYYRARLPITSSSEEYADYWVTKVAEEGFDKFKLYASDNPNLALTLIWDYFLEKIKRSLSPSEYEVYDKGKFSRTINLIIGYHPEGKEVIQIEPYFLKAEKKFGFLIDYAFKTNKDTPYSIRVQELSLSIKKGQSNPDFYDDKLDKIRLFLRQYRAKLFPFQIGIESFDIENQLYPLKSLSLKTKTYIFQNEKSDNSQFMGLKKFGPLQRIDKDPLYVFIFQPQHREAANDLYRALIGKSYPNNFSGLQTMFHLPLSAETVKHIAIPNLTQDGLSNVKVELQKIKEENGDKKIIGIFIINEKESIAGFSPYHYLKLIFTENKVPLQTVKLDKIMTKDGLKWSVGNIALQIFAKLGGIPWKVKPSNEKCLIFGIGSAHKQDSMGRVVKYYAYSVCLDSSGIYKKINVLGNAGDRESYISQLRDNVKSVILENLNGEVEKCVIHLPFKIKNDEIRSIRNALNDVHSEYSKIEFQFIKINTNNKFFGYAENNSKVPYESTYIQLSSNEFLVWFEGLQYGKENVRKRVGNPVHIEFLQAKDLTPLKKRDYLQDVINLSGANWRGFNAKLEPISVYYPKIIADFIGEFRQFEPDEDIDLTDFYIPWFL